MKTITILKFISNVMFNSNSFIKNGLLITVLTFSFLFTNGQMSGSTYNKKESKTHQAIYEKDEIYVKLNNNQTVEAIYTSPVADILKEMPFLQSYIQKYEITSIERAFWFAKNENLRRIFRIRFSNYSLIDQLIETISGMSTVEYAEKIPVNRLSYTPNDLDSNTYVGQYSLYKVHAREAWDLCRGKINTIVVAVVDNAFNINHEDLVNQFTAGYDVSDNDSDPTPPNANFAHGTHCAGIVSATTNNGIGYASLGYNLQIMPVKAQKDSNDPDKINKGLEGITWAADHGADVISCSWGSSAPALTGQLVINDAHDLGSIIVAAAGNDNLDNTSFPANYYHVIAVASTGISDMKSDFSNFGDWIDVCAPGNFILSTIPYDDYAYMDGTSMACPLVASLCGLVLSLDPTLSPGAVEYCITSTADNIDNENPSFIGKLGSGRINAYQALLYAMQCNSTATLTGAINNAKVEVQNSIEASGTVNSDILLLDAGNHIDLTTGFQASNGKELHAYIDGCGGTRLGSGESGSATGNENKNENMRDDFNATFYPNPFTTSGTIGFMPNDTGTLNITVLTINGQVAKSVRYRIGEAYKYYEFTLDMDNVSTGFYFLKLSIGNNSTIRKIVKT